MCFPNACCTQHVICGYWRAPNAHQQMCTTGRTFQRLGGLLSNHPAQNQESDELSNEKAHCKKKRSLKCKLWNAVKSRRDAPKERPFWKHRAPKLRLVEAQYAHRKHCFPENHLGVIPLLGSRKGRESAKIHFFRGSFSQMGKLTWHQHWTHAK